jgi:SAM-dependent methyltransferase
MREDVSMSESPPQAAPWEWDETLYRGSAAYYPIGRVAYPPEFVQAITTELAFDGTGRLLDCGCGPGSLTLLLAPFVAEVVGIDADPGMIDAAAQGARALGVTNASWRQLRAEDLPADLGEFRFVTFAQSFHWMDQRVVAPAIRSMLAPGGVCVTVWGTTHEGRPGDDDLPRPRPPRSDIAALIRRYLGEDKRAGRGILPLGPWGHNPTAMRAAGFDGPFRFEPGADRVLLRSEDEIVASVFSLSSATPHLFGDRVADFERDLRALLRATAPDGQFAERMGKNAFEVWRPRAD